MIQGNLGDCAYLAAAAAIAHCLIFASIQNTSICAKKLLKFSFLKCFSICGQNYTLEWFPEAGSAPIRSAVKFYFDLDVRIFFHFQKYFRSITKSWKIENFQRKSRLFFLRIFDFFRFLFLQLCD